MGEKNELNFSQKLSRSGKSLLRNLIRKTNFRSGMFLCLDAQTLNHFIVTPPLTLTPLCF